MLPRAIDINFFFHVHWPCIARTREYRVAGSECNECSRRPIHLAQARRSRRFHPLRPRTIPCPQGGADGDGRLVRRRQVEFRVWGRLTVELCFSRPANSRAEPSRPLMFLSLSLFSLSLSPFLVVRPSRIQFTRDRDAYATQRQGCRLDSLFLSDYRRDFHRAVHGSRIGNLER